MLTLSLVEISATIENGIMSNKPVIMIHLRLNKECRRKAYTAIRLYYTPILLFKASIFRAQGHISERNHCWDDREVVGIQVRPGLIGCVVHVDPSRPHHGLNLMYIYTTGVGLT